MITYINDYFNKYNVTHLTELEHQTEEITLMMVISKVGGPTPYNLIHFFVGPDVDYMIGFVFCDASLNPSIQLLESFSDIRELGFDFDPSITLDDVFNAGRVVELCEDEYIEMNARVYDFGVLYLDEKKSM